MANEQFTERQLDEAWRQLHAQHLERQSRALESIRSYVGWLLAITLILIVMQVFAVAAVSGGNGF
jgi:hypothetical protein